MVYGGHPLQPHRVIQYLLKKFNHMRLQIKATGFELTPSLRQFIEDKLGGLENILKRWDENDSVIIRVEVAKNTKHHQKGNIFYVEANIDLPKKVIRVEEVGEDMREAVDKLKDRLKNEVSKIKEKATDY